MAAVATIRRQVQVCIGKAGLPVGSLVPARRARAMAACARLRHQPVPGKERESKTWLSEQDGPITDVQMLLARASYFALDRQQALAVLGEVHAAVSNWRQVALGSEVGLSAAELDDFAPAFEHEQMDSAAVLLGR